MAAARLSISRRQAANYRAGSLARPLEAAPAATANANRREKLVAVLLHLLLFSALSFISNQVTIGWL